MGNALLSNIMNAPLFTTPYERQGRTDGRSFTEDARSVSVISHAREIAASCLTKRFAAGDRF
jgi:hypothetical protein